MIDKGAIAIMVLILSLFPGSAQKTDSSMTIQQLDREVERAVLKNDIAALDRILAEDYLEIDAQGGVHLTNLFKRFPIVRPIDHYPKATV